MEIDPTPLGHFTYLPVEIRERIWLNFLPCGEDSEDARHAFEKDLVIRRTNSTLHYEVSSTLYDKSELEFELTPCPDAWLRVTFTTEHYLLATAPTVTWVIQDVDDAHSRGFQHLPFHIISEIVIKLYAPNPDSAAEIFILFDKVTKLVELLRHASTIDNLCIVFEKNGNQEWHHRWEFDEEGDVEEQSHPMPEANDCDAMTVPFCDLRNIENISVEAHSEELYKLINWRIINWATDVVSDRSWEAYFPVSPDVDYLRVDHTPGTDVQWKVAEYSLLIHLELWQNDYTPLARNLRRDILQQCFTHGSSESHNPTPFEREIIRIASVYPDLIKSFDTNMDIFERIQRVVVCSYDQSKPGGLTSSDIPDSDWDYRAWEIIEENMLYGTGLMPFWGMWFDDEVVDVLGEIDVYRECLRKAGRDSSLALGGWFVEDWCTRGA